MLCNLILYERTFNLGIWKFEYELDDIPRQGDLICGKFTHIERLDKVAKQHNTEIDYTIVETVRWGLDRKFVDIVASIVWLGFPAGEEKG